MSLALCTNGLKTGFSSLRRPFVLGNLHANFCVSFYPAAENNAKSAFLNAINDKIGRVKRKEKDNKTIHSK